MTRAASALAALLLAGCAAARPAPPPADFSGAWTLDRSRSELSAPDAGARRAGPLGIPELDALGEGVGDAAAERTVRLEIDHRDPVLRIERHVVELGRERTVVVVLYTDGREAENPGPRGEVVRSRSGFEGAVLVTRAQRAVTGPSGRLVRAQVEERRALEEGGRAFVTEIRLSGPDLARRLRLVFAREANVAR